MFRAEVDVMLRSAILDVEGKTVAHALGSLGYDSVDSVRVGNPGENLIGPEWDEAAEEAAAAEAAENEEAEAAAALAAPVEDDVTEDQVFDAVVEPTDSRD